MGQAMKDEKPVVYTHENFKVYSALKQCMQNNAELREALVDAAEMIERLTQELEKRNES